MVLKAHTLRLVEELFTRYPVLSQQKDSIMNALHALLVCYKSSGKVMVCGNGGSASDSEHIVGELLKSFSRKRPLDPSFCITLKTMYGEEEADIIQKNLEGALPAISLVSQTGLITAFSNDVNPEYIFAQQAYAYCSPGDILWGLSTSGNSKNVVHALKVAKARGAVTLGMTGAGGGAMQSFCDIIIRVPETETFKVQELHLPVYHLLCAAVETEIFD